MTTHTYDNVDDLPDLNQDKKPKKPKNQYQSVDELPDLTAPSKKKDSPFPSPNSYLGGGIAGTGNGVTHSEKKISWIEKVRQFAKEKTDQVQGATKIDLEDDDPIGDVINPMEKSANEAFGRLEKYGTPGMQQADNTYRRLMVDGKPVNQRITPQLQKQSEQSNLKLDITANQLYQDAFKDGKEATEYLARKVQQNPKLDPSKNRTVQFAIGRANRYAEVKQTVEQSGDLDKASMEAALKSNPHLAKQLEVLQGEIPEVVKATYLNSFLHDPDVKASVQDNPALKAEYDYLKNGGIYEKYPEWAEVYARNIISREYEKRKANPVMNVIISGNSQSLYLDQLADELLKDQPQLMKIVNEKLKGNWEGKVDTAGIVDEVATGASEGFAGMWQSAKDLVGLGKSEKERIREELDKQYGSVSSGVTGWRADLNKAAHFGGTIFSMAGAGAPLRLAGLNPTVANAIVTSATFFDKEKNLAAMKYPGEPWKQNLEAIMMTTLYNVASRALPSKQLTNVLTKAKPQIRTVIGNLNEAATQQELKNSLMRVTKDALGGIAGGTAEMIGLTVVNKELDKALGMDDQTMREFHPDDEILDVAKSMVLGLAFPKAYAAYSNRNAVAKSLYSIAENPMRYKDVLQYNSVGKQELAVDLNKKIEDIDFLSKVKKQLDEKGISRKNQERYLLEAMNEKYLRDKMTASPESSLLRELDRKVTEAQLVKDDILSGKDVVGKEEEAQYNDKEKAAVEAIRQLDLSDTGLRWYADVIQNPNSTPEEVKEALRSISDQLTDPNTAETVDVQLKGAADKIYDLGYDRMEPVEFEKESGKPEEISQPIELDPALPEGYELPKKESDFDPERDVIILDHLREPKNETKTEQETASSAEPKPSEEKLTLEEDVARETEGSAGEPPIPPTEPPKPESGETGGEGKKELDKLSNNVPDSGRVAEYMSKDTIEKYTGETPTNDQRRGVQELGIALQHGEKIIEKAKEIYGNDYVEKTLDYIDQSTAGVSNKALMYVSLENAIGREKLANPDKAAELTKLQALVYARSQAFARENSLALNYQKLRKIATEGYDLSKVTDAFFSSKELENKAELEKAVEATPEQINKAAEQMEVGGIDPLIEQKVREGVEKEINKLYEALPKERKTAADKAISALEAIQKKLRGRAYDAGLGVPVAIIDAGITVIKNAIKAGVKVSEAIEVGISKIKELYGKDWAKEEDFRRDLTEGFKEQGIAESQQRRENWKEYRKLETERNRQLRIINDLTDKLKELEAGQLKKGKKPESKEDVPEILELRKKVAEERKQLEKLEAQQKRVEKLEDELRRLRDKLPEDKKDTKTRDISDREKELNELIKDEKKTNREYVKNALIEQGFGRDITVKEVDPTTGKKVDVKKQVLDWKKLAGEAGTVSKISENVGKVLEKDGFTEAQLEAIKDDFIKQYVEIRASVVEKSLNELARRNKETVSPAQKTAARRLAELYTYGLFEQRSEEYENVINTALGARVSPEGFAEAKEIAKAMQTIYSNSFKGIRLDEMSAKSAIEKLDDQLRILLHREARKQGNGNLKTANIVRNYFEIQQTMLLNNLKQATENPLSGLQQNIIDKIQANVNKTSTPELANQRRKLMKDVYKDMVVNSGIGYGKVESQFVNRQHIDDYVNKMSDNQIYHGIMSIVTGKTTLNAMDAMYKAGLTERKFTTNLLKILTSDTNPNKMNKSDALKFVSEKLTGQSFKDAQQTAKSIIEKINKDAGKELISTNQTAIDRFANDIVKASLEMGGKITKEQIEAAYNAAYRAAGLGLGHVANNPVSASVQGRSGQLEAAINEALKEKDFNKAAVNTYESILWRNMMNPFVGGGTNWLILKLEKAGLGLFTGLYYRIKDGKSMRIDVGSDVGMKKLENALYQQSRVKDNFMRGLIGGSVTLASYLAFLGIANTDEYKEWRKKNPWASRYLDVITPEWILADMALEDPKQFKKYLATSLNKNDAFDSQKKIIKAGDYFLKGDASKGWGALGEAVGAKFNAPFPWRLVKDGQVIYQGVRGQDPYHGNYKPSEGFLSGVLQGGVIEWLGGRPIGKSAEEKRIEKLPSFIQEDFKRTEDKSFIPSEPSATITVKGEQIKLEGDRKTKYEELVNEKRQELLTKFLDTEAGKKMYQKLPDIARQKLLSEIYDAGRELAKAEFLKESKGVTEEADKKLKEKIDLIKQQIEERKEK